MKIAKLYFYPFTNNIFSIKTQTYIFLSKSEDHISVKTIKKVSC